MAWAKYQPKQRVMSSDAAERAAERRFIKERAEEKKQAAQAARRKQLVAKAPSGKMSILRSVQMKGMTKKALRANPKNWKQLALTGTGAKGGAGYKPGKGGAGLAKIGGAVKPVVASGPKKFVGKVSSQKRGLTAGYKAQQGRGTNLGYKGAMPGGVSKTGAHGKYGAVMQGKRGGKYVMVNGAKYYVKG